MKTFAISDCHFGHANIIKYCKRPFRYAQEMDDTIIKNFNSVVSNDDHVYFMGDFSMSNDPGYLNNIFYRLNGKLKVLIRGNHDSRNVIKLPWYRVDYYNELYYKDVLFCMMHYPIKIWNKKHHGSICLGGHSHLKVNEFKERYMDVGVDGNNYFPVDFEDILSKMLPIKGYELSHHGKEE